MKRRKQPQPVLFPVSLDDRSGVIGLYNAQSANWIVGDFFELATSSLLHGNLLTTPGDMIPDVEDGDGRYYESKATGSSGWLIDEQQFLDYQMFVDEGESESRKVLYSLWHYRIRGRIYKLCETRREVLDLLCSNVVSCDIMDLKSLWFVLKSAPKQNYGYWSPDRNDASFWRVAKSRLPKCLLGELITGLTVIVEGCKFVLSDFTLTYHLSDYLRSSVRGEDLDFDFSREKPE